MMIVHTESSAIMHQQFFLFSFQHSANTSGNDSCKQSAESWKCNIYLLDFQGPKGSLSRQFTVQTVYTFYLLCNYNVTSRGIVVRLEITWTKKLIKTRGYSAQSDCMVKSIETDDNHYMRVQSLFGFLLLLYFQTCKIYTKSSVLC